MLLFAAANYSTIHKLTAASKPCLQAQDADLIQNFYTNKRPGSKSTSATIKSNLSATKVPPIILTALPICQRINCINIKNKYLLWNDQFYKKMHRQGPFGEQMYCVLLIHRRKNQLSQSLPKNMGQLTARTFCF